MNLELKKENFEVPASSSGSFRPIMDGDKLNEEDQKDIGPSSAS
jgi:hypothetical protein